jgi:GTPase SAR1 family protein
MIIGPSGSGKTSLIGVLQFATGRLARQPNKRLRMLPASADMNELIGLSNAAVEHGRLPIPSTRQIKRYIFDYTVSQSDSGNMFRQTDSTRFSMIDTSGGAILGDAQTWAEAGFDVEEMKKARAEAIAQLKSASYIILCADATDNKAAAYFVRHLPNLLAETGTERLACEKLVICLTKADRYVANHDRITTQEQFRYEDPIERAVHVISDVSLNILAMYLREDVEIRAGWASVYGFDPKTGLPNYDPDNDCLLINTSIDAEPADILERWHPYQLIDPFVFLTTGDTMGLKKMPTLEEGLPGVPRPEIVKTIQLPFEGMQKRLSTFWRWCVALFRYLK